MRYYNLFVFPYIKQQNFKQANLEKCGNAKFKL